MGNHTLVDCSALSGLKMPRRCKQMAAVTMALQPLQMLELATLPAAVVSLEGAS